MLIRLSVTCLLALTSCRDVGFTTDHGTTWTPRNLPISGRVQDIQVSSTDAPTAYAVISNLTNSPFGIVFETTNGGATWTNISGNLAVNQAYWSLQIDSTTPGHPFVGAGDGVYVTANDGDSWSRFGRGLPGVQVFAIELSSNLGILGAGTHGRGSWEIALAGPSVTAPPTVAPNHTTTGTVANGPANPPEPRLKKKELTSC